MDKTLQRWANIAIIAFAIYYFGALFWSDYQDRVADIQRVTRSHHDQMDR